MFREVALSLALVVFAASSAGATRLANVQGDVLINKGDGFTPASNNLLLLPGNQIQVLEGSAQIVYDNGYVESMGPHQLAIVLIEPPAPGSTASYTLTGGRLYEAVALINSYRRSKHRQPLTLDSRLIAAASALAVNNANHDRKSHAGPNGADLVKRLEASGYNYRVAAEIVETGPRSPAELFNVWQKGADERRNMLLPDVTQMGFAQEYRSNKNNFFWVLVVATPK